MNTTIPRHLFAVSCLIVLAAEAPARAEPTEAAEAPDFAEVRRLVRENLKGVSDQELNRAAVSGFLNGLYPMVTLVTNTVDPDGVLDGDSLISKSTVFDNSYGYVRIPAIQTGAAEQASTAIEELRTANSLKGIILDLRFSAGRDYEAAAEVADLFLDLEGPVLKWGKSISSSTATGDAIKLPVAVLVNKWTAGAAEALAGVLQDAKVSLLIGASTAGQARVYEEFTLGNGQRIRVASGTLRFGDNRPFPEAGLTPDVEVTVDESTERAYLKDPFANGTPESQESAASATGPARRRINESDLLRLRGEGVGIDGGGGHNTRKSESAPLITDPALSRALDFLKGLALLKNQR